MADIIALDAGHGMFTAGKRTPDDIREWYLNDKVRDKAVLMLMDYDVQFIFPDNNEGNTDEALLKRRAAYVNSGAKAMASIHHNAFKGVWGYHTGVGTYVDRNCTAADMRLAECIQKRLPEYTGLKDRGIKKEDFTVIYQNKVPAVLTEGGFMDSRIDYPVITSDAGQTAYARAVAEGLIEFCNLKKADGTSGPIVVPTVQPSAPAASGKKKLGKVNITYQAFTDRWWPAVTNQNDWSGRGDGTPIRYLAVKVDKGMIRGRVYTEKNGWLADLTFKNSYDLNDLNYGVMGDGSPIEAVELYYYTPDGYEYQKAHYRVSAEDSKQYYAVQVDNETGAGMDGYAGMKGKFIDKFQVWIE